jgi:O-6-methylguanine DNA methyltransferase
MALWQVRFIEISQKNEYLKRLNLTSWRLLSAEVLGSSPRAVGGALRNNPFAPTVPCHRIVAASGAMNGFSGATEGPLIDKKANLLKSEGVKLDFASGDARVENSFVLSKEDLRSIAGAAFPAKSPKKSPKK